MKRHEEAVKRASEADHRGAAVDIVATSTGVAAPSPEGRHSLGPHQQGGDERRDVAGVVRGSEEAGVESTALPLDEEDLDSLLASLSRRADSEARVGRSKSSSSAAAAGGGGLFRMLTGGEAGDGSKGVRAPGDDIDAGKVQRTLEALRQRLRAAERARDDAAEQVSDPDPDLDLDPDLALGVPPSVQETMPPSR